jgi:hypothetical protein
MNIIDSSKIIEDAQKYLNAEKLYRSIRKYNYGETPNLDDVRLGLARVNSKGRIKWIPVKKIRPVSLRKQIFGMFLIQPLLRRINYSEIAKNLIVVEPMVMNYE